MTHTNHQVKAKNKQNALLMVQIKEVSTSKFHKAYFAFHQLGPLSIEPEILIYKYVYFSTNSKYYPSH